MKKIDITMVLSAIIVGGAIIYAANTYTAQTSSSLTDEQFAQMLDRYIQNQKAQADKEQEQARAARAQKAKSVAPIDEKDHVQGPRDATVTIFEYSDFECPFCKRFYKTPGAVVKAMDDVNTVYRHFPLAFHDPLATQQAIATECVAQQGGDTAFFAIHDAIFEKTRSNGKGMTVQELKALARAQVSDAAKFETCFADADGTMRARVQRDIDSGTAAGITGTPGVIVRNNKTGAVRVLPGAVPVEMVENAVKEVRADTGDDA